MEHSIEDWIAAAPRDRVTFRQAVHIVLQAVASSEYLQPRMIMKGGMLMGLRYQSSRFTEDIDFSTSLRYADIDEACSVKSSVNLSKLPLMNYLTRFCVPCRVLRYSLKMWKTPLSRPLN